MRLVLYYKSVEVPVSDDRGHVRGAAIRWQERHEVTVIPPEGDGPDCWLGKGVVLRPRGVSWYEWVGAAEVAAGRCAQGEAEGAIAVDADDEEVS